MESVKLYPAYMWECPQCGAINFGEEVKCEWQPELQQYLEEEYGSSEGVEMFDLPVEVECGECFRCYDCEPVDLDEAGDVDE